jgi:hypothetical protein
VASRYALQVMVRWVGEPVIVVLVGAVRENVKVKPEL